MSDEGKGNKELVGLGHHLRSETEKIENGLVGDGHGFFQDGESRINKMGEDLKEGNEMVSWSGVASGQIHSQQPPQGASVCWERFLHVGSLRVLLVENDDSTRHIVAALLRNCSYEVVEVSNGVQAWKVLEDITNRIDLVLTEVVMPCVSGVALLCKIMSHKTRKNVPVIMMSSHDSMGLVFKCLSKGAVDFLVKPIRKNELKNLWQHVWRRCHSSSGSGSESGTQTQKSVKSKSAKKLDNDSGSNDEEEIGSPVLNFGDGSDHGSGTQSSWTKQAMEDQVDSPRQVSPMDEIPECPASTCAQVIHANPKPSGDKMVSVTAVKDCQEGRELPEKTLEKNVPKISDRQPACAVEVPVELTIMNHSNAPKIESSRCSEQIDQCMGDSNGENLPGQFNCRDPERIGVVNSVDPCTDSENKNCDAASKYSKMPEINDKAVNDNKEPVSVEQGIKRLRGVQDIGKAMQEDRNVLRRSESSAFSRYNATLHNKISHNDARSPSPLENGLDGKNGVLLNIQSHSGSNAPNQCSNGVSIYVDMTSTSNYEPFQKVVLKSKAAETKESHPSAFQPVKTDHLCAPEQTLLDNINGLQTVKVIVHPVSSNQGLQIQKMGHQFDQNQKPGHNMQLETPSSNLKNLHKKMAAPIPFCGSSNVLDGHVEGNAANYSVNGSASGSNYGSNGQNGSSSAANAGLTNMESDNGVGGKSWCGDASGSGSGGGSGNNIDQNKSAQREAALTKFRQKRKERCFKRKVRYYSRKRLAEQRPRVRGQFVRQTAPESLSKEGTDDGRF